MIAGGAAAEAEVSQKLAQYAKTISGIESECINAYAEVRACPDTTSSMELTKARCRLGTRSGALHVGAERRSQRAFDSD